MSMSTQKKVLGIAITVLLVVLVPAAFWLLAAALDSLIGLGKIRPSGGLRIGAAASILVGLFWVSGAYSYLYFVGKGLPPEVFGSALHPTRQLVTTGPYAYTRHPMVLGMFFILLGAALLQRSISGLVLAPVLIALFMIYLVRVEEPVLAKRFGEDYQRYRRCVPLLFPRLRAYAHSPTCAA